MSAYIPYRDFCGMSVGDLPGGATFVERVTFHRLVQTMPSSSAGGWR